MAHQQLNQGNEVLAKNEPETDSIAHMSILNRPKILFWTILLLSMVLMAVCLQSFARAGYPLLTTDAVGFLPAAASWHSGHSLDNPLYSLNQVMGLDSTDKRFLYYAPLYPMLLGELMPDTSVQSYYFANNILILLTLGSYLVFWSLLARRLTARSWKSATLIGVLGMLALMGGLDSRTGRPENLSHLLFWLALTTAFVPHKSLKAGLHGILWALMCGAHMLGGIYLALILCAYYAHLGIAGKDCLWMLLGTSLMGLTLLWLSPYSLWEMLEGVIQHMGLQAHRNPPSLTGFLYSFFISYTYSFYFFLFVAAIIAALRISRPFLKCARWPVLLTLVLACLSLLIFYCSFRTTETPYNLYMLAPLFFVLVLLPLREKWQRSPKQTHRWTWGLIGLFSILSVGFVKRTLLFGDHLARGASYQVAAAKFAELPWDQVSKVGVSFSLFPLIDRKHWAKIEAVSPQGFSPLDSKFDLLILQQTYSGNKTPRHRLGYTLVTDNFSPDGVHFSQIRLSNSIPGYQFAVYKSQHSPLMIEMDGDK